MQTFLPYADFKHSARVLDDKRLGKQRVEALQILTTLCTGRRAWAHHPAVRMWRGYEYSLIMYGVACCDEWISRGFNDTCREKILSYTPDTFLPIEPPWLGAHIFHQSHQSNLIRKDEQYYHPFFPTVPNDLPYIWPTNN